MQLPRFLLVSLAAAAVIVTGCRSTRVDTGETSTGLPYRPPGVPTFVEPPAGFSAPEPGEPLSERRYLPPTPELESEPVRSRARPLTGGGAPAAAVAGPVLRSREQQALELAVPKNEWYDAASTWRGAPYRLGGTTRQGVDCSGLVQQLYKEVRNKDLPRTTGELWEASSSTGVGAVRPGDLVFFAIKRVFGDESQHVGLVLGNRVFIHSSSSMGVTYGSLDDSYWGKRFTGSRRFE